MNETFLDKATLKRQTGKDVYGKYTYDSGTEIKCRFIAKQRLTKDLGGNQVISEGLVMTETPVSLGDLLVYNGRKFTALSVFEVKDLAGNSLYWEVVL